MNILRIIASVDPRQGGPVEGLTRSAKVLETLGHGTEVLSLDPPSQFDLPWPVHAMGPVARKYGYTPKVGQWMQANAGRFDAAVVHGLWNHAVVGGGLAAARMRLPYVVFPHGMMDPWFRQAQPAKHLAKQLLWWAGQGQVLQRAHAVLFTSEQERAAAEGVFHGPGYHGRVVPYGAAEPSLAPGGQMRARLPGQGRYLLFLGRIHPKKGCDLLLEGFAQVPSDLHLVLAGPDEAGLAPGLLARARALGLGGRVHAVGMLTGDAKWDALAGAEAFVLPSHQENFGIAVAEALACGTPVLISDKVNTWREIVADGAGIVAPDSVAGVVALLQQWQQMDAGRKATMRVAARRCFEERFRIERAAEALLAVLSEAAGSRV